jgi:hypothetical protein
MDRATKSSPDAIAWLRQYVPLQTDLWLGQAMLSVMERIREGRKAGDADEVARQEEILALLRADDERRKRNR